MGKIISDLYNIYFILMIFISIDLSYIEYMVSINYLRFALHIVNNWVTIAFCQ